MVRVMMMKWVRARGEVLSGDDKGVFMRWKITV